MGRSIIGLPSETFIVPLGRNTLFLLPISTGLPSAVGSLGMYRVVVVVVVVVIGQIFIDWLLYGLFRGRYEWSTSTSTVILVNTSLIPMVM